MAGLASPDIPAYYCYLIVLFFGAVVGRANVSERLKDYPDHWAFLGSWSLFLAYWAIPPLLFWFLDYTNAVQDTSLFAALLVAFGYRQIFASGVQGLSLPGQTSALWKPFQAWVDKVAERIAGRQKRYRDRFKELLRSDLSQDPARLQTLEQLALQHSARLVELRQSLAGLQAIPEPAVAMSRKFDLLWDELRTFAGDNYGDLLNNQGLVTRRRRWWWLERGRAKLVSLGSLVVVMAAVIGLWLWSSNDAQGSSVRESTLLRYHQWRFLKATATERDRWRSREFFVRELRAAAAQPLRSLADARAAADRARADVEKAGLAVANAKSGEEQAKAKQMLAMAQEKAQASIKAEASAAFIDALVRPLLRELRFPEIPSRQADEILRLVVDHHAPYLNGFYVPELIESLRTPNEVVRRNIHKTLLALQSADYHKAQPSAELARWEPQKNENPSDIDRHVRLWQQWWRTAQAALASA